MTDEEINELAMKNTKLPNEQIFHSNIMNCMVASRFTLSVVHAPWEAVINRIEQLIKSAQNFDIDLCAEPIDTATYALKCKLLDFADAEVFCLPINYDEINLPNQIIDRFSRLVEAQTQMEMTSVRTVKPKMDQPFTNFGNNDLLIHKSNFNVYSVIFYNYENTTVNVYLQSLRDNEYYDEYDFQKVMDDEKRSLKKMAYVTESRQRKKLQKQEQQQQQP